MSPAAPPAPQTASTDGVRSDAPNNRTPPAPAGELAAFHRWLGTRIENPSERFPVTLENCVEEFRLYCEEGERLSEEVRRGIESGPPRRWDKDLFWKEFRGRMAAKGVRV